MVEMARCAVRTPQRGRDYLLGLRFFQLLFNFAFFAMNIFQVALEKR